MTQPTSDRSTPSSPSQSAPKPSAPNQSTVDQSRDSFTLRILGAFLLLLASLTFLGVFQAELSIDRWLTALASGALLLVGGVMIHLSRKSER